MQTPQLREMLYRNTTDKAAYLRKELLVDSLELFVGELSARAVMHEALVPLVELSL